MAHTNTTKQTGFFAGLREFVGLLLLVLAIRVFLFGLYQVPTGSMETTMLVGERFFADKLSYFFRKPVRGEIISFNDPEFVYSSNPIIKLLQHYILGPFPRNWGPDNWTKRIIGEPGDLVEGRIVDGVPTVYINGERLNEPYLNKYPLIRVWRQDPYEMMAQIETDIVQKYGTIHINKEELENMVYKRMIYDTRSYDPSVDYDKQPFYRVDATKIVTDELIMPGSLIQPQAETQAPENQTRFWNGSDVFRVQLSDTEYWCMGDNRLGSKDCRVFGPIKGEYILGRILFLIWSIDSTESWWIVDLIKHPIDFWKRLRLSRFFKWVH